MNDEWLATSQFTRIPPKQDPPSEGSQFSSSAVQPPARNSNANINPGLDGFSSRIILKDDSRVLESVGDVPVKLSFEFFTLGTKASASAIPSSRTTIAGGHCPLEI